MNFDYTFFFYKKNWNEWESYVFSTELKAKECKFKRALQLLIVQFGRPNDQISYIFFT